MKNIFLIIGLIIFYGFSGIAQNQDTKKESKNRNTKQTVNNNALQKNEFKLLKDSLILDLKKEKNDLVVYRANIDTTVKKLGTKLALIENRVEELEAKSSSKSFVAFIQWSVILILFFFQIKPVLFSRFQKTTKKDGLEEPDKNFIIRTVLESPEIANQFQPKVNMSPKLKEVEEKKLVTLIVERVLELINLDKEKKHNVEFSKDDKKEYKQEINSKSEGKYFKEREGLYLFKETIREYSYYEVFNIDGNKATYRFCGNDERAIENYDAVLKDVFDDEKTYFLKAQKVLVKEEGTVELQPDGKWKIITLAKINFI